MSGFMFEGVIQSPDGDWVPNITMSDEAYSRIRARWSVVQFTDATGEPIRGSYRESLLHETVLDDALWQFWLSNDVKSWQRMSVDQKVWLLGYCIQDGKWWREWAEVNLGFHWWPWQKRLAFERVAVRESINAESPTPTVAEPDHTRREVALQMVKWHEDFDSENRNISPHDVPASYVGLSFETI